MTLPQLRSWILRVAYPINVFIGKLKIPYMDRKMLEVPASELNKLFTLLKPGMVLCTHKKLEPTNFLIPGKYTHAAMYVGDNMVVEALGKGVITKHIVNFIMDKDYLYVLAPKFADLEQMVLAAEKAKTWVGRPYDYQLKGDNEAFYCAELCAEAYNEVLPSSPFTPRLTFEVETYTAQDFVNATSKWHRMWYHNEKTLKG